MEFKPSNENYFFFKLSKNEKESIAAKEFTESLKIEIPYKGRYWMKEKRCWAIHKEYFNTFFELLKKFYYNLCFNQGELFYE